MLSLVAAGVERAMKRQEVILRALSGALTWLQAADIRGIDPRSLRRWRARYAADQQLGLYDRRHLLCLRLRRGCGVRGGGVRAWERGAGKGREGAEGVDVDYALAQGQIRRFMANCSPDAD